MASAKHQATQWRDVVPSVDLGKLRQVKAKDYLVRFVLGAVISIGAGILVKEVGPRFGGMFLAFPAILPASLTLVQKEEGSRQADRNAIGAILGGFGLSVFGLIVEKTAFNVEPFVSIVLALCGWAVTAVTLYAVLAILRPESADKSHAYEG